MKRNITRKMKRTMQRNLNRNRACSGTGVKPFVGSDSWPNNSVPQGKELGLWDTYSSGPLATD